VTIEFGISREPVPPTRRSTRRRNQLVEILGQLVRENDRSIVRVAKYSSPTGASRAALALGKRNDLPGRFDLSPRVLYNEDGERVGSALWVQYMPVGADTGELVS